MSPSLSNRIEYQLNDPVDLNIYKTKCDLFEKNKIEP